ncbi:MAG: D-sedoheptulose 7-phosphate isomerase [Cellvibrionales bacterium]|nr:D-sedoheptulose 7-phosphate isomerase [Cellvibrionales bacterium]
MIEQIKSHIAESIHTKQALLDDPDFMQSLAAVAKTCRDALDSGHKILIAGNGGSAADAQHMAAELVGRFEKERASLPGIALTTDTSALTAIANDYGYEHVFSRQLQGLGQAGDIFIGISTSGNSANIIKAVEMAKSKAIKSIALTGIGGQLEALADVTLSIPSPRTAIVQESHIMIAHLLCHLIDSE